MHLEDDEGMDAIEAWKDGFKFLANKIMKQEDTRSKCTVVMHGMGKSNLF